MGSLKSARTLGCGYGKTKVFLMQILQDKEGIVLERFDVFARPSNQEECSKLLKECLQKGYNVDGVRISIKGQSVVVRFIQFPRMTKEELQGAIQYEAENYIPFKLEEVILDFCILGESLKSEPSNLMMDVLLIAVKKDEIYPLLQDFQNADTRVEIIDIDILAAMNAVEYFFPEDFKEKSIALLDIGSEISSICVIKQGKPKFIRDISFGGGDISKKLRRKLGMSAEEAMKVLESPKTASPEAQEILKEGYETLCSDLKLTIDYYLTEVQGAAAVDKIFLGGGGHAEQLKEGLNPTMNIEVENISFMEKVKISDSVNKEDLLINQSMLPVAFGLCLRKR